MDSQEALEQLAALSPLARWIDRRELETTHKDSLKVECTR